MKSRREDIQVTFTTESALTGLFRPPSWNADRGKAWVSSVPNDKSRRSSPSLYDRGLRKVRDADFVRLVAMDLLASCNTINSFLVGISLREAFYNDRENNMITALELHRRKQCSPAAGHHARESSAASRWPALYSGEDREEALAAQSMEKRKLAQMDEGSSDQEVFW